MRNLPHPTYGHHGSVQVHKCLQSKGKCLHCGVQALISHRRRSRSCNEVAGRTFSCVYACRGSAKEYVLQLSEPQASRACDAVTYRNRVCPCSKQRPQVDALRLFSGGHDPAYQPGCTGALAMRRLPRIADKKQLHDAARVAAGVCILTSVGIIAWTYGSKQGLPYLEHAAQGLQWGAITVLLVSYPVVGRTARTGVERALGTIAGTP
jgi:hypothetical protein